MPRKNKNTSRSAAGKVKVKLVLNSLRGIAGKDYPAGKSILTGALEIPGMTADEMEKALAAKEISVFEAK